MSFDQRIKICSWQVLDSGRVHADSKDQEGTTPLMLVGYQIFKLKINPYFTSQCNNCPGCNQRPCQNCQPSAGRGSRPQPQVSLPHSFSVSDKSCSVHSCPKNWQFVRLLENYWVVTDVTNTPPLLSVFFTWRLFDCHTIRENIKHSWDFNRNLPSLSWRQNFSRWNWFYFLWIQLLLRWDFETFVKCQPHLVGIWLIALCSLKTNFHHERTICFGFNWNSFF